jgi:hypothetical protein
MAKQKSKMTPDEIGKAITGLIMIGAGIWIYFHFFHTSAPVTSNMPPEEAAFTNAVFQAKTAWGATQNEIAQAGVRSTRASALCNAVPGGRFKDWTGTLTSVQTNMLPDINGKNSATVTVTIAPGIQLTTGANTITAPAADLVEQGSPVYQAAGSVQTGASVTFSGALLPSAADCFDELRVTTSGGMLDPEFDMRLTTISSP